MSVVGAFTGGNDGGTGAVSTTPALLPSGAGTPLPGDIPVCFSCDNSGSQTINSSSPTQVLDAGPTYVSTTLGGYQTCEAGGLIAAEITADSLTFTWSASARNLSCGVLLRNVATLGRVIGTPNSATTAATINLPTITAPAGSTVVVCVVARAAQITPPTIATADLTNAGYTIGRNVATAYPASPNFRMVTATIANFAGGSIGGSSVGITGTPTGSETFIIAFPAAAPLPAPRPRRRPQPARRTRTVPPVPALPDSLPAAPRRRHRTPFVALRRRLAVIPPTPVVAAATLAIPQPRRRVQPFGFLRRRPALIVPPVVTATPTLSLPAPRRRVTLLARITRRPAVLPPDAPNPLATQRRRALPPTRVTRRPAVIPPTPVVVTPSLPLPAPRRRPIPFLRITRRPAHIPPTPVVVAPSTLPTVAPRRRVFLLPRTRRAPQVIPPAAAQAPVTIVGQITRRRTTPAPARRTRPQAVPPPATTPLPQPTRARRAPLLRRRTRGAQLPPAQVVTTAPLPPSAPRRRRWFTPWRARRNAGQFPFAGGTAPVIVTPFDGKVGHPRTRWGTGRPAPYLPADTLPVTAWRTGAPRVYPNPRHGRDRWTASTVNLRSGPHAP